MVRLLILIALLLPAWVVYSATRSRHVEPQPAQTFVPYVPTTNNVPWSVEPTAAQQSSTVYLFLSLHCPISNYYTPLLNQLSTTYASDGIKFIGVVSDVIATPEEIEQHRRQFNISFPILCDHNNELAQRWGATITPQAVVIDSNNSIAYSGRIDDLYPDIGQKRLAPTTNDLSDVLESLARGFPITTPHNKAVGCRIAQTPSRSHSSVTYHGAVAAILYRECANCHRPGQVAPFSLLTYEDAKLHADQIDFAVEKKLMPPWHAAPNYGHFKNEQFLSDEERDLIKDWITAGMPQGDPSTGPRPPKFRDGWQLGTPDLILEMPQPFEVPADGPDIYQHFILPTGLLQDRLVAAIEFQPGAVEVVHHGGFFIDTEGNARKLDEADPSPGYSSLGVTGFPSKGSLGSWGPGRMPSRLPAHMGRPLWKNSDVVMQIHYHPVGRPVKDVSRLAIYFAPPTAHQLVCEIMVANVDLDIPAGANHHHHRAEYILPVDTTLLNNNPHMHLLGKAAKCYAILPDGNEVPLIHVPRYDFYWQTEYVYQEPIRLPAGTKLILDCWFDNSTGNPLNFNSPPKPVDWGDNSTDEMAICYFRVTADSVEDVNKLYWDSSQTFGKLWDRYQQNKAKKEQPNSVPSPLRGEGGSASLTDEGER